jgi:hypothetical protein
MTAMRKSGAQAIHDEHYPRPGCVLCGVRAVAVPIAGVAAADT